MKKVLGIILSTAIILTCSCGQEVKKPVLKKPLLKTTTTKDADKLLREAAQGDRVYADIAYLCSKECAGRLVGTKGNELSGNYIADNFKRFGLLSPEGINGYKQLYKQNSLCLQGPSILEVVDKNGTLVKKFKYAEEFVGYLKPGAGIKGEGTTEAYIIDTMEKLKNVKAFTNHIVLIEKNVLEGDFSLEEFLSVDGCKTSGVLLEEDVTEKGKTLKRLAATFRSDLGTDFSIKERPITFKVESRNFKSLKKLLIKGNKIHMAENCEFKKDIDTFNVVGMIAAGGDESEKENIIIGAHFDHSGDNMDGTYNPGALDNASGVACMMEIARVISQKHLVPKKNIYFVAFNGEEVGGKGSMNFVNSRVCNLQKSVMINLDMEGFKNNKPTSIDTMDGTKNQLQEKLSKIAAELKIKAVEEIEDASDHSNFSTIGVDSVLIIDNDISKIHTSYDVPENLDKKELGRTVQLVLKYLADNAF